MRPDDAAAPAAVVRDGEVTMPVHGTPCLARIRRRWRLGYGASVDHRMARGSRGRRITALRPTTYCLRYTGGNVVI